MMTYVAHACDMIDSLWTVVKNVNRLHKEDIFTFSYSC